MAHVSGLDGATTHLIEFSIAIATGRPEVLEAAADALAGSDVPAGWVDELLLQSVLMVGWPRALMAAGAWRMASGRSAPEVDDDGYHRHEAWTSRGEKTCRRVYGANYEKLRVNVRRLHPALDAWMVTEGYGRTLSRPGLDIVRRELCTVAQTAVLDTPHQLHSHLRGALNVGATEQEIEGTLSLAESVLSPSRQTDVRARWREVRERSSHAD